jgi:heme exporter protein A
MLPTINPMLSAINVSCTRGSRVLFTGRGFALGGGEWLHVRGSNGSGKTSLLRILAGLSAPDAGEVRWQGELVRAGCAQWHQDLLFLGHNAAVKDELTPLENLHAANALDGIALSEDDALRALSRFGLRGREDLPVRFLSAGQRRRLLLARTLTRPAKAWILDEPFTALDAVAVEDFAAVITDHLGRGGIAVLTSHQSVPLADGQQVLL